MQNYLTLKTSVPYLQLQPLTKKHLTFLVDLLSSKEIQRTLFRVPTKITEEKEFKAITRMYEGELPKEITYILTIKKLFTEKFIGYVKIKLIDWSVKSCYLSVAILPDAEYRGKGYAIATYNAFFEYLFSLGFMKIYGRTYEPNISTVRLNNATGFNFIGRQRDFILYPDDTSLDALLFERNNPLLQTKYQKPFENQMKQLVKVVYPLTHARQVGLVTEDLITETLEKLSASDISKLMEPQKLFIQEIIQGLNDELASKKDCINEVSNSPQRAIFRQLRAENAIDNGLELLAFPITRSQMHAEQEFYECLMALISENQPIHKKTDSLDTAIRFGAFTEKNWSYLEHLFLGLKTKHSPINIIIAIKNTLQ